MVNFGFQLVIEVMSALVILPMGLDGVEAVCSSDLDVDGVGASGGGSYPPCQAQITVGSDVEAAWEGAGVYLMSPRISVTRYPEIGESDFFGPLLAVSI